MVLFNPLTDGRFLTVITTYYHRFRGQPFKAETISLSNDKNGVDCYSCDRSLHGKVKTEQQWDCANEKKKNKNDLPIQGTQRFIYDAAAPSSIGCANDDAMKLGEKVAKLMMRTDLNFHRAFHYRVGFLIALPFPIRIS